MLNENKNAYITGGASGIGRALTIQLLEAGWRVFVADRDPSGVQTVATSHNQRHPILGFTECEVSSWDSQLAAFQQGLMFLEGRIDFVAPVAGIGEKQWLPFGAESNCMSAGEFAKPNLSVVDVDLTGVLYTISLAVQQFRRQDILEDDRWQFRGKIGLVGSVCGLYCVPALPIYTAAKHAVIGLTRSYGKLLQEECITVNALAPHVVRTAISSDVFYDKLEAEGLLTPMDSLMEAFWDMLNGSASGQVYECGPESKSWQLREGTNYLDEKSKMCCELLQEIARARGLHYASS
ncbi:NAD(P)-binding protein [Plenodomus tracheiphilus IPT5]|uniref:NAD(P)-binding protein n=1 Tax=Plenodomus tracheiphilus IPT5 TaxID=1408161 RepID=A0A6A7BBE4_9PLEO|nr:NAD(P)-binding protein [Plenodomus tracheiphilus IPT5]